MLRSGLNDAVVLARRFHHCPAFFDVMGQRLFDVDVLASFAGENRRYRVPMVWSAYQHGIHILALQHLPEVLVSLGRASHPLRVPSLHSRRKRRMLRRTQLLHLRHQLCDMRAASAAADQRDTHAIVGAEDFACRQRCC